MYTTLVNEKIFNELMENLEVETSVCWWGGTKPTELPFEEKMILVSVDEGKLFYTTIKTKMIFIETVVVTHYRFLEEMKTLYPKKAYPKFNMWDKVCVDNTETKVVGIHSCDGKIVYTLGHSCFRVFNESEIILK